MSKGAPGELASPEVDYSMPAVVTFWSLVCSLAPFVLPLGPLWSPKRSSQGPSGPVS